MSAWTQLQEVVNRAAYVEAMWLEDQCHEALRLHEGSPLALMIVTRSKDEGGTLDRAIPPAVASRWPQEAP